MSSSLVTIVVVLAISIVVILAIIAYRLHTKVRVMEEKKRIEREALEKQQQEHREYLINSIRILSQGVIDGQVTLTEAAIRISVLLDNLNVSDAIKSDYSVFYQLAEATSHIPILDGWKKLSSKERFNFDRERLAAEEKWADFMVDAAKKIKIQAF